MATVVAAVLTQKPAHNNYIRKSGQSCRYGIFFGSAQVGRRAVFVFVFSRLGVHLDCVCRRCTKCHYIIGDKPETAFHHWGLFSTSVQAGVCAARPCTIGIILYFNFVRAVFVPRLSVRECGVSIRETIEVSSGGE